MFFMRCDKRRGAPTKKADSDRVRRGSHQLYKAARSVRARFMRRKIIPLYAEKVNNILPRDMPGRKAPKSGPCARRHVLARRPHYADFSRKNAVKERYGLELVTTYT